MATTWNVQVRSWGSTGSYFNLTPYIKLEGAQWSINPIDASDTGRDQSGKMHRQRVGEWRRLDLAFIPLPRETITSILQATSAEWLQVQYTDLQTGATRTSKMYRGATLNATHKFFKGTLQLWAGMVLELIEE